MQYLLLHFGYAFLVLGLVIEGDATLVAAIILASSGQPYLQTKYVLALALVVTVGGNELLYQLGSLGCFANLGTGKHYQRASRWLRGSRGGLLALLFSRFMWGFRLMIPFAAGLLHIRRRRFSVSNLIGGVVWVGLLSYFGVAIESLLEMVHHDLLLYQSHLAIALFLLGLVVGLASIPWQVIRRGQRPTIWLSVVPRGRAAKPSPGGQTGARGPRKYASSRPAETATTEPRLSSHRWQP